MANLSAAVNVITTDGPLGRAGMTVSAARALTDSPPTTPVCVNRSTRSHDILRIYVNDHEALATRFTGSTTSRARR